MSILHFGCFMLLNPIFKRKMFLVPLHFRLLSSSFLCLYSRVLTHKGLEGVLTNEMAALSKKQKTHKSCLLRYNSPRAVYPKMPTTRFLPLRRSPAAVGASPLGGLCVGAPFTLFSVLSQHPGQPQWTVLRSITSTPGMYPKSPRHLVREQRHPVSTAGRLQQPRHGSCLSAHHPTSQSGP